MARRTVVTTYDDLDGTEGASTVSFAYRGMSYEIDLSEENQAALGAALAKYIVAARPIGRIPVSAASRSSISATSRRRNRAAVRAWARAEGLAVSDRGRVPSAVQKAYDAAH